MAKEKSEVGIFELIAGATLPLYLGTLAYFSIYNMPFRPSLDDMIYFWKNIFPEGFYTSVFVCIFGLSIFRSWIHKKILANQYGQVKANIATKINWFALSDEGKNIGSVLFVAFSVVLLILVDLHDLRRWIEVVLLAIVALAIVLVPSFVKIKWGNFDALLAYTFICMLFYVSISVFIKRTIHYPLDEGKLFSIWRTEQNEYLVSCDSPMSRLVRRSWISERIKMEKINENSFDVVVPIEYSNIAFKCSEYFGNE